MAFESSDAASIERLADFLESPETGTAASFRCAADRAGYIVLHAATRLLVPRLLACRGDAWRLDKDRLGAPRIRYGARGGVAVSMAHTRGLAAGTIAPGYAVGIDAEPADAAGLDGTDEAWLAPEEIAALAMLAPAARRDARVRLWTLKEAFAKALGRGMHLPFTDIAFALDPPRLLRAPPTCGGSWQFVHMPPTPSHVLSLAVRRRGKRPVPVTIATLTLAELLSLAGEEPPRLGTQVSLRLDTGRCGRPTAG